MNKLDDGMQLTTSSLNGSSSSWFPDFEALDFMLRGLGAYASASAQNPGLPPAPVQVPDDLPSHVLELAVAFDLSDFERNVLLLCLLCSESTEASSMLAGLNQNARLNLPLRSSALALLSHDRASDQRALYADAKLFTFGLLRGDANFSNNPRLSLTPRAHRWLTDASARHAGASDLNWASLEPLLHRAFLEPRAAVLTQAQERLLGDMRGAWKSGSVLQLHGGDAESRRAVAANVCEAAGLSLQVVALELEDFQLHGFDAEVERSNAPSSAVQDWICALNRESVLCNSAFLFEIDDANPALLRRVAEVLERTKATVLVSSRRALHLGVSPRYRNVQRFELPFESMEDQLELWLQALVNTAPSLSNDAGVDWTALQESLLPRVLNFMTLNASMIARAVREALTSFLGRYGSFTDLEDNATQLDSLEDGLWESARAQVRAKFDALPVVERVFSSTTRDDLVLPEDVALAYDRILKQVRFAREARAKNVISGERGRAVTALFSGLSGTGKTTSVEALANDLNLDLYRIDLSQVQSKYIGETSKNLQAVFDAAQSGGVVLLFDEADALFGKRSATKDSHDRYANAEVNYLLQSIEVFQGLAILTTNLETSIDEAFQRRLRFIVRFELPSASEREHIWQRVIPNWVHPSGNSISDLEFPKLAQLEITGANIKNIVMQAGFDALEYGGMTMLNVFHAARAELKKQGYSWNWAWVRDWVLPDDITAGIPEDSAFASLNVEAVQGLKHLFKKAGVPSVTSKPLTREWHGSVTETVLNLYCFDSRPNTRMGGTGMTTKDGKSRIAHHDFLFCAFVASKNDDERRKLAATVVSVIAANPYMPLDLLPSADGYQVHLRSGTDAEKARLHQATSHLDVPAEAGLVFSVTVPMKVPWKSGN
jgi:hypothetical protein